VLKEEQVGRSVRISHLVGNHVSVRLRKKPDLSSEIYQLSIDPALIRDQPDRVEVLVQEAVNDALSKVCLCCGCCNYPARKSKNCKGQCPKTRLLTL
jgi:hypothetical protein